MDFRKLKKLDTPAVWLAVLFGVPVAIWLIWGVYIFAQGYEVWGHEAPRRGLNGACPAYCG